MGKVWRTAQHGVTARLGEARLDETRPEEARLVEGLRRRAPEALAGLHEEYATGIYNLALRVVRHPSDAEDITQDVLIRAFERLPRDREVLLRPWLYRLTLNRCYDYLRVAARRPLAAAPEHEAPSPHDPFDQSELQRLLEASLGDLTRRQRAALLLKDVHGLTLVEVGACLDLTPGSVEVLLARARRAFRASFEDRCVAAGRPVPRSAGALVVLPLLPLPAALGAPPLALPLAAPAVAPTPAPFLPIGPAVGAPLTAATGGGIGALLGLPSSVKTAVLVAAAAASLGSAELVATSADQRPPRPQPHAAAVSAAVAHGVTATTSGRCEPAAPAAVAAAAVSATPSPAPMSPAPAATASAEPSPQGSPLAIPTPVTTPDDSPSPTPDAHATTPASPSASPSPSAMPTGTPSADPSPSPSSDSSPTPSPSAGL